MATHFSTPTFRSIAPGLLRAAACAVLAWMIAGPAWTQSNVPQTRLVPVGPSLGGPAPPPPATPNFAPPPALGAPAPSFGGGTFGGGTLGGSQFGGGQFGGGQFGGNGPAFGGPTFDPYATGVTAGPGFANSGFPTTPNRGLFGGLFSRPAAGGINGGFSPGPVLNSPAITTPPGTFDNPSVYGPPVNLPQAGFGGGLSGGGFGGAGFGGGGFGSPTPSATFPNSIYPQSTPSTLFPGGLFGGGGGLGGGGGFGGGNPGNSQFSAFRFLHGPRLRHTWIAAGNDDDALEVNTTDASAIFAFPNFLYGTQPIYVVPSFSLHLFDGPNSSTGADLPGQTYSAFLDFGYNSDPNRIIGTELGVRVGVFSDFESPQGDALRVLGKGLVNFRLTPAATVKLGVYYLDRVDWKLIPAGGVLYQPNPFTRFDIFFPQPKFAKYWRTLGTQDVWWYLAGDYGGGSWAVEREDGSEDQVDINELQAIFGFEWGRSDQIRTGRRTAFAEIGYVFDRELVYRNFPSQNLALDDGFMFRLGFGY